MKVSDLPGKSLLSLADAQSIGFIANIWFDKKLQYAKTAEIVSDDDAFPERSFVPLRKLHCDADAAVISSLAAVQAQNTASATVACPINRPAFNQSGKSLGKIRDLTLDGTRVVQILCEHATFTPRELLKVSDTLCLFNDTGAPVKLGRAHAHAAAPRPAPAQPSAPPVPSVQTPQTPQAVTVTRTPGVPVKDYTFLLGKTVHSPVLCDGRILIPVGTRVDATIIEKARKAGKLVCLALRAY